MRRRRRVGRHEFGRTLLAGAAAGLASALCATQAGAVSCSTSVTPLAMGAYNGVTKAQITSNATFTLSCTGPGTLSFTVTFSPGDSGAQSNRYMTSGASHLNYQIYGDSAYTQVLGDGTGSTHTFAQSGVNLPSGTSTGTATIYGRVTAGQTVIPGNYSDAIIVVMTY